MASGKRFGKRRVPNCECTHRFTCRPCLEDAHRRALAPGNETARSHIEAAAIRAREGLIALEEREMEEIDRIAEMEARIARLEEWVAHFHRQAHTATLSIAEATQDIEFGPLTSNG